MRNSHQPDAPKSLPGSVYGYAAVAAFSSFVYGYNTGLIAPAIIFIPRTIPIDLVQTGLIVSVILFGAILGSLVSGSLADMMGRRRLLAWNNLVMLGAAIIASLGDDSYTLIASRFILGLGVGVASVIPNLYITEIAPTHIRGKLGAFNQLNGWTGIIVSYFVGYETVVCAAGEYCWRYMFASGAVLCIFHFVLTILYLPESPLWLVNKGKSQEALSVLTRIYGDKHEEYVIRQYQILSEKRGQNEPMCMNLVEFAKNKWILFITIILQFLQQLTGNSVILYYTTYVFNAYGYTKREALFYNAVACIPQLLVLIGVVFLLDSSGRKPAMFISEIGIALSLAVIAAATTLSDSDNQFWLLLVGVVFHRVAFAAGMGPVPSVLVAESLPFAIRGRGLALTQAINWLINFIITFSFPKIFYEHEGALVYWIFAGCSLLGSFFIAACIEETKNVSLEEIEEEQQQQQKQDQLRNDTSMLV